jgi:hypothetical protein
LGEALSEALAMSVLLSVLGSVAVADAVSLGDAVAEPVPEAVALLLHDALGVTEGLALRVARYLEEELALAVGKTSRARC